jgi:hypothetical protein
MTNQTIVKPELRLNESFAVGIYLDSTHTEDLHDCEPSQSSTRGEHLEERERVRMLRLKRLALARMQGLLQKPNSHSFGSFLFNLAEPVLGKSSVFYTKTV